MLVQGSNAVFNFTIGNTVGPLDISDAKLFLVFKKGNQTIRKECTLVEASTGRCYANMTAEDLSHSGTYKYQIVVEFIDGTILKSAINAFYVSDSLE